MQTQTDDFVPMHAADWIEPGTETMAQQLEALQCLAASAQAASLEIDAMWAAEDTEEYLPVHSIERGPGLKDGDTELQALLRCDNALEALMREVEAMRDDGSIKLLTRAVQHIGFAEILIDVTVAQAEADAMDTAQ